MRAATKPDPARPSTSTPPAGGIDALIKDRFPTAYTILMALIVLVGAPSWLIPAGEYTRVMKDAHGKNVPIPGSYHTVEAIPQGIVAMILAPINGFYSQAAGTANAIDVALFVLVNGGFLGSNGCAKSATIKLLRGLLPASEGKAFLLGEPIAARNVETRRRTG